MSERGALMTDDLALRVQRDLGQIEGGMRGIQQMLESMARARERDMESGEDRHKEMLAMIASLEEKQNRQYGGDLVWRYVRTTIIGFATSAIVVFGNAWLNHKS